jgi:rubrerythrin
MASQKLAAPELAVVRVGGMTREAFLVRATLAAGATYGATMAAPFITRAVADSGGGDIDILNYALTLEYLETKFYEEALDKVSGLDADTKSLAQEIRDNEAEHVDGLRATIQQLGGQSVEEPTFDFGPAFKDVATFLKTANTLEDTGVSAYNGAAPNIESKEVLGAAGGIAQVEARHAALIRLARDKPPAPAAFDKASEMKKVLAAVQPFIKK